MSNSLFDFLGFNFDDIETWFYDWKDKAANKYDDITDTLSKKYDLTTQEGYEGFINEAANIRKKLLEYDNKFANSLVKLLDSWVEKAMKYHEEHIKNTNTKTVDNEVNDIVNNEVKRSIDENGGKVNTVDVKCDCEEQLPDPEEDEIEWPSDKLTYKQRRYIRNLVDTYMDSMILPYIDDNCTDDMIDDMASGLFEFAAWIINYNEE